MSAYPKTLEASLARFPQMLWPSVARPGPRARPQEPALRGDHEPFRVRVEGLGDQELAHLRAVRVGRVDEIDAQFDGTAQDPERVLPVVRPPENPRTAKPHGTKAEAANLYVAADREGVGAGGHEPLTLAAAAPPEDQWAQAQSSRATAA